MTSLETAVWPNDVVSAPQMIPRDHPFEVICLLLSPFKPKDQFDQVTVAVKLACDLCRERSAISVKCIRLDMLFESKPIQDDIWRYTQLADVIVIDVTNFNPNVMFEFGVAAAVRRPNQVILIKSNDDESQQPFDIAPHRCLVYHRAIVGDANFVERLAASIAQASTPAPYVPPTALSDAHGFTTLDLRNVDRSDLLLAPAVSHRRIAEDGLEVGSFFRWDHSWVQFTRSQYRNVRARVTFRFSEILPGSDKAHFSLGIRSQHYLANWAGYMLLVGSDGNVWHTEPKDDAGGYDDILHEPLESFDPCKDEFIELSAEINDERLALRVANAHREIPIRDMKYVYNAGYVKVAMWKCRVRIQQVELTPL